MGIVSGIVVYLITWWTVLFAVLPWGVRVPDRPSAGHAPSAPIAPRLKAKLIATSVISAVIWLIIFAVVEADVLSIRDWASTL